MKSPTLNTATGRALTAMIIAAFGIVLSGCGSGTEVRKGCAFSMAAIDTPIQLAEFSDLLVSATVTKKSMASKSLASCGFRDWTTKIQITSVHGQRPGVSQTLKPGMSISMRASLFDSDSGFDINVPAVSDERDALHLGDHVIAYLYDARLHKPAFEAAGYAILGTGEQATMQAVLGNLNHQTLPVAALTTEVVGEFSTPR